MLLKNIIIFVSLIFIFCIYYLPFASAQKFTLDFPKEWTLQKGEEGFDLIAKAPPFGSDDLFRENVNVISQPIQIPLKMEELSLANIAVLEKVLVDFNLESEKKVNLAGAVADKIIYTHRIGPVNLKVIQYLILKDDKVYILTFTADSLDYSKIEKEFVAIAGTFKLQD
jgi:hypothetical protein